MKSYRWIRLLVCLVFVAGLLACSGCGFHFGRTKTPEGGIDESITLDLLQTDFSAADDLSPPSGSASTL